MFAWVIGRLPLSTGWILGLAGGHVNRTRENGYRPGKPN